MNLYSVFGVVSFLPIWAFRGNLDYLNLFYIFIIFFLIPLFFHIKILKNYSPGFGVFFSMWMSFLFIYSVDQNLGLWTLSLRITELPISNYIKSSISLLMFFFLSLIIILKLKKNGVKIFFSIILTVFIFNILDTSRNLSNFPKVETNNFFNAKEKNDG